LGLPFTVFRKSLRDIVRARRELEGTLRQKKDGLGWAE
jgi:cytochrome P450